MGKENKNPRGSRISRAVMLEAWLGEGKRERDLSSAKEDKRLTDGMRRVQRRELLC